MRVTVGVLGPTEARRAGAVVDLGTPKQRALLAALALHSGRVVSVGLLEELLWPGEPPPAVAASLHAYVSGLRRALEPDRPRRSPARVLVTSVPGYVLRLPAEAVDASCFVEAVTRVHRSLAGSGDDPLSSLLLEEGRGAAELNAHAHALAEALALWRGEPYADLGDVDAAVAERARLDGLLRMAQEDLVAVRLALGEHAGLAPELAALRLDDPLHEGLAARAALAHYRCDRQADALAELRVLRQRLADELGIDPGPLVQALELAVLRQDPRLTWRGPRRDDSGASSEPGPVAAVGEPPASPVGVLDRDPRHWPLIGRSSEIASLCSAVDAVADGATRFALVVGEPGIGKTRITEELSARARSRGFLVLAGRCSEDEGAPPLWPWMAVLDDLVRQLDADRRTTVLSPYEGLVAELLPPGALGTAVAVRDRSDGSPEERRFRVWDAVGRVLLAAAADQPVLVVLDDLHWADTSSLRLLRHLAQTLPDGRLLIVGTRRSSPEPAGALAEVGDALARRHGLRLDLTGLGLGDVERLVSMAGGRAPVTGSVRDLWARTDGNPFFVVELVRWQGSGRQRPGEVPTAVADVVTRRVAQLPPATQDLLRSASVVGRAFGLDLLARVRGQDEDDVLDDLDPALAAGLVDESTDPVGTFRFAHALARDAVYAGLSPLRRARQHAEVAAQLADRPAEAAFHWLAAGPEHAGPAWRAAATAADQAQRVFAHEEAARLLAQALAAMTDDPTATREDRYELLLRRAEACRWAADLDGLDASLTEAIGVADALGDVERTVRAAIGATEGSLWSTRDYGSTDPTVLRALELALRELPPGDGEERCRAMLALAAELFHEDQSERVAALVDEGLAMARRLGDPRLRLWACHAAHLAQWRSRLADRRLVLADEAAGLATELGDHAALANALALRAAVEQELGQVERMWSDVERVRAVAGPRRLAYPLLLVGWLEVPWLAMAGRFDEAEALFARTLELSEGGSVRQAREAAFGALLSLRYWQGRLPELLPLLPALEDSPVPVIGSTKAFLLAATNHLDEAREQVERAGRPLPVPDDWLTVITLYQHARIWTLLGERDAASGVYQALAPFAGRVASAGSAVALGPVDSTLAMLAGFLGERDLAAGHADSALRQCEAWNIPLAAQELLRWRSTYRF